MHTTSGPQRTSAKAIAAILVLVVCCLLSTARIVFEAPRPRHISSDDISKRSDQRFAALKARLPASGVIGYIGETGDSATPDYYLTQYALAPLVVDPSPQHSLVVGNFPSSPPFTIPQNLRLVEDFGQGVMLLAAKDAP
jgi:hypothetical protein